MTYRVYRWPPAFNAVFEGTKDECKQYLAALAPGDLPYYWVETLAGDIIHQPKERKSNDLSVGVSNVRKDL